MITKEQIFKILEEVKDPEIPVLSLVDLGVITDVIISEEGKVKIEMTPTFSGCPAMDIMKSEVIKVLEENGIKDYQVRISFEKPWNTGLISEKGRIALKNFGLAPPPAQSLIEDLDILENIECPYCQSNDTTLKSPFGPTLCRSIHYCNHCRQAFEQFKPL
ncbi:phenylacetate-CoA oxygenase subunit PaaJ [soil metagenome]|jgi:ring-1,2-phenylacetyl-CoA epoxidase subunit PaaD